jgi:hypothetical protein
MYCPYEDPKPSDFGLCDSCEGSGEQVNIESVFGSMEPCFACNGTGKEIAESITDFAFKGTDSFYEQQDKWLKECYEEVMGCKLPDDISASHLKDFHIVVEHNGTIQLYNLKYKGNTISVFAYKIDGTGFKTSFTHCFKNNH